MKFLGISSLKDTISTLPPAVSRQLMEATADWVNQQKKAGTILEIYFMAGWNRTVVIMEQKSAEEVVRNMSTIPMQAFMNFETYPLADFNESLKAFIESIKAAEQMFPGPPR